MSSKLQKLGYECTEEFYKRYDKGLSLIEQIKSFRRFVGGLSDGDKVVVYYSGHGFQMKEGNYLLCAKEHDNELIDRRVVDLNFFIEELRTKRTKNIFLLDCLYDDNPKDSITRGIICHTISNIKVRGGEFVIGFACLNGNKAKERAKESGGGDFTRSLVKFLSKEEDALEIITKTNDDMYRLFQRQGMVISTVLEKIYF